MNLNSNTNHWNKIKGICLDCDGVLTDGRVYVGDDGFF